MDIASLLLPATALVWQPRVGQTALSVVVKATLDLVFDDPGGDIGLPEGSPFPDWRSARRFAGPMPFTFSPEEDGRFVVIEGSRAEWTPRPVALKHWQVGIFDEAPLNQASPVPANAFAVNDIDYRWQRGRIVKPGGGA